jgi:predicted membrane-bound spermidine synthase
LLGAVQRRLFAPLRVYGVAEVIAGFCAIAIGLGFGCIETWSVALTHLGGTQGALVTALGILVAALFVGPPALLMGVTIPAIVGFAELRRQSKRLMSLLYAANVGGGLCAALLCPYVLFPHLGMTGTSLVVGCVQVAIGAYAVLSSSGDPIAAKAVAVDVAVA